MEQWSRAQGENSLGAGAGPAAGIRFAIVSSAFSLKQNLRAERVPTDRSTLQVNKRISLIFSEALILRLCIYLYPLVPDSPPQSHLGPAVYGHGRRIVASLVTKGPIGDREGYMFPLSLGN